MPWNFHACGNGTVLIIKVFYTYLIPYHHNSLLYNLPQTHWTTAVGAQHRCQDSITQTEVWAHGISIILGELHWLPVTLRAECEILLLTLQVAEWHGSSHTYWTSWRATNPHVPCTLTAALPAVSRTQLTYGNSKSFHRTAPMSTVECPSSTLAKLTVPRCF